MAWSIVVNWNYFIGVVFFCPSKRFFYDVDAAWNKKTPFCSLKLDGNALVHVRTNDFICCFNQKVMETYFFLVTNWTRKIISKIVASTRKKERNDRKQTEWEMFSSHCKQMSFVYSGTFNFLLLFTHHTESKTRCRLNFMSVFRSVFNWTIVIQKTGAA